MATTPTPTTQPFYQFGPDFSTPPLVYPTQAQPTAKTQTSGGYAPPPKSTLPGISQQGIPRSETNPLDWWNPVADVKAIAPSLKDMFSFGGGKSGGSSGSSSPGQTTADKASSVINSVFGSYVDANGQPINIQGYLSWFKTNYPKMFKGSFDENKLRTDLENYASANQWKPNLGGSPGTSGLGQGNEAGILDPLGVQLFWQNTIAPYMSQIASDQADTAQGFKNLAAQAQNLPGLTAGQKSGIAAEDLQQAQGTMAGSEATRAASVIQPRVDQLLNMIANYQKQSLATQRQDVISGQQAGAATPGGAISALQDYAGA